MLCGLLRSERAELSTMIFDSSFENLEEGLVEATSHVFLQGRQVMVFLSEGEKYIPAGEHCYEFRFDLGGQQLPPSGVYTCGRSAVQVTYLLEVNFKLATEVQLGKDLRVLGAGVKREEQFKSNILAFSLRQYCCLVGRGQYCFEVVTHCNSYAAGDELRGRVLFYRQFEKTDDLRVLQSVWLRLYRRTRVGHPFFRESFGVEEISSSLANEVEIRLEDCRVEYGMMSSHFVVSLRDDLPTTVHSECLDCRYFFVLELTKNNGN